MNSWRNITIDELGQVVTGFTPPIKKTEYFGDEYPFITPTDISMDSRIVQTERFLSEKGYKYRKNRLLPRDAVCVTCIGATIGKICMTTVPSATNQQLNSVVVNQEKHNPYFVYYLLRSKKSVIQNLGGGVATPIVNKSTFARINICVPPLHTQRKIADILSEYDELIEINQQQIALLERAGREIYCEWFVRLRFPGHECTKTVDGIPEGWASMTYSDVFKFLGGFAFKSKTYQPEGRYGIVTIKNVHNARFIPECASRLDDIPEKMKEHCVLSTGDILLSLTGDVGRCCMVSGESYLLNQRVVRVDGNTGIPKSFAYWTFSNEATRRQLENLAHGAAQSNLSPVKLGNRPFIKPASEILRLFSKIADPIFWQITTLNLAIVELRRARDLLLPRLMSGKLTV